MIRKANPEDVDEIERIYSKARSYMRDNGNPSQWGTTYPDRSIILGDIKDSHCYVLADDKKIIHSVFAFLPGPDPTYLKIEDGAWLNDDPYFVIHRVASDGVIRGTLGIILQFCLSVSGNIRMDTHRDNLKMQSLLLKYHFSRCGIIHLANGSERIAFQYTGSRLG
jgi:hypothetical protein